MDRPRARVLIVSFYFPPAGGGGVQRVLKWVEHLPEFDWDVHVLCPGDPRWIDRDPGLPIPGSAMVHRVPYVGLRPGKPAEILHGTAGMQRLVRKLALQPRRLLVPDVVATWRYTAIRAGVRAVQDHGIDVVLSTSPPPTDHIVARGIADATGIPYVCDLRDSWLHDPRLRLSSPIVRAKRRIAARMERRTVGSADAVTCAAASIAEEIQERHPHLADDVHVIENGVELADMIPEPALARPDRFVLTHTGGFFGLRTPARLLDAVEAWWDADRASARQLLLRLVGQVPPADVARIRASAALSNTVELTGFQPYRTALAHQLAADALALIIPDTPDRHGMVTGKLFEYLGARRHILAMVPADGAAAGIVESTGSGRAVPTNDVDAIADELAVLHRAWSRGQNPELSTLDDAVLQRISRRGQAEQLARVLDATLAPTAVPATGLR